MKTPIVFLLLVSVLSCRQNNAVYYNVCSKSDAINYNLNGELTWLKPSDPLYQDICNYLRSDDFKTDDSKSHRNVNSYRFDFFKENKKVKTLTILDLNMNHDHFVMDDFGSDHYYLCNTEKTKELLKKLGLVNY